MSNITLKSLLSDRAISGYNDPGFMTFIDDHLVQLRSSTGTKMITVEPSVALRFRGDLYGMYADLGLPYYVHFITMKMNYFNSPTQIQKDIITTMIVPDLGEVKKLYNLWRAHNAIRK